MGPSGHAVGGGPQGSPGSEQCGPRMRAVLQSSTCSPDFGALFKLGEMCHPSGIVHISSIPWTVSFSFNL